MLDKADVERTSLEHVLKTHLGQDGDVSGEGDEVYASVTEVHAGTLDAELKRNWAEGRLSVVMFYAAWCGHCKKLAPGFFELAHEFSSSTQKGKEIRFLAYDADSTRVDRVKASQYDAHRGWPTVVIFDRPLAPALLGDEEGEGDTVDLDEIGDGDQNKWDTGYGEAGWKEWADTPVNAENLRAKLLLLQREDVYSLPSGKSIENALDDVTSVAKESVSSGVAVVGFGLSPDAAAAFARVAHRHREEVHFSFGAGADLSAPLWSAAAGVFGPKQRDVVVGGSGVCLYKPYEEAADDRWICADPAFTGWGEEEDSGPAGAAAPERALESFVLRNKFPLAAQITRENWKFFVRAEGKSPLCFIFATPEQVVAMRPWVTKLARTTRGKLNFVFIDWDEFHGSAHKLGVHPLVAPPAVAIENTTSKKKWAMELPHAGEDAPRADAYAAVTEETLADFVALWTSEDIEPSYISEDEPVPAVDSDGILKLVHSNFPSEVIHGPGAGKDVFVQFYAPWCGFCKKLKPVWQELAAELAESSVDHLVLAKFDKTANDLPEGIEPVNMFPTLRLWKAGDKSNPIQYDSDNKTIEALTEWLQEHSSQRFDIFVDRTEGANLDVGEATEEL